MARQLLKAEKLLKIMNDQMTRYDTCVECRFKSIIPLAEPDKTGCNWSHANLNCRAYPATDGDLAGLCQPAAVCQPLAARMIAEAKERYNVF